MSKIAYNANYIGLNLSKAAIQWLGRHGIYNKYPDIEDLDNLPRHEPLLIQCLEELTEAAEGCYSTIVVAEIKSDTYYIAGTENGEIVITPEDMIKIQQ